MPEVRCPVCEGEGTVLSSVQCCDHSCSNRQRVECAECLGDGNTHECDAECAHGPPGKIRDSLPTISVRRGSIRYSDAP